jgi:predicted enzyme related to lactoylglutathione lyase
MPVMDVPGIGQMATLRDPTGAVISIYHGKGHPGAAQHGFAAGGVGWHELMTTDTEAASAFYSALFGWEPNPQDMGGYTYTTFNKNGQGVAGMMGMSGPDWEGIPPHWMVYVTVDNTDDTAARSKSLGGEVAVEPQDIPSIGRFAVIRDPSGAPFSVIKWAPEMLG